jgi:hypothetical protein
MAMFSKKIMKGMDIILQQTTFEKFITHPLVTDMLPKYLKNLDSIKCNLEILGNFKYSLTVHLLGFCKIELIVAKNIVCTLASNQTINSCRGVVKSLGVNR